MHVHVLQTLELNSGVWKRATETKTSAALSAHVAQQGLFFFINISKWSVFSPTLYFHHFSAGECPFHSSSVNVSESKRDSRDDC